MQKNLFLQKTLFLGYFWPICSPFWFILTLLDTKSLVAILNEICLGWKFPWGVRGDTRQFRKIVWKVKRSSLGLDSFSAFHNSLRQQWQMISLGCGYERHIWLISSNNCVWLESVRGGDCYDTLSPLVFLFLIEVVIVNISKLTIISLFIVIN